MPIASSLQRAASALMDATLHSTTYNTLPELPFSLTEAQPATVDVIEWNLLNFQIVCFLVYFFKDLN